MLKYLILTAALVYNIQALIPLDSPISCLSESLPIPASGLTDVLPLAPTVLQPLIQAVCKFRDDAVKTLPSVVDCLIGPCKNPTLTGVKEQNKTFFKLLVSIHYI